MKRKKIILVCIILFPSLFYFLFELTQANFKKMAYYGPKTVAAKGDTIYYSTPNFSFKTNLKLQSLEKKPGDNLEIGAKNLTSDSVTIDTTNYPVYLILFLDNKLRKDGYKLEALFDYAQYKPAEFKNIPLFFISNFNDACEGYKENQELKGDFDSLKINLPSFHPLLAHGNNAKEAYFKGKPNYVFNYFAVLIDKKRHIRGYYDPSQNSEIKRMVQEYKHLKTKDEYANTLEQNKIYKK